MTQRVVLHTRDVYMSHGLLLCLVEVVHHHALHLVVLDGLEDLLAEHQQHAHAGNTANHPHHAFLLLAGFFLLGSLDGVLLLLLPIGYGVGGSL